MSTVERIKVNGIEREYVLHIPKNMLSEPDVIISLHGGNSNGKEWWSRHWDRHADQGFIIVCPTAGNHQGQGDNWVCIGDEKWGKKLDIKADENFILAITEFLQKKYLTNKTFVTGFSSGSKMAHSLYVTQSDKFDGFSMSGQGIREAASKIKPPAEKPVRLSFGTEDDNFAHPDDDVLDAAETLFWYMDELQPKGKPSSRQKILGKQTKAIVLSWNLLPILQAVKIIGMPHRWPKVAMGDPFNEDDAAIEFFRKYAGMK